LSFDPMSPTPTTASVTTNISEVGSEASAEFDDTWRFHGKGSENGVTKKITTTWRGQFLRFQNIETVGILTESFWLRVIPIWFISGWKPPNH
jgi:hypothetical protein